MSSPSHPNIENILKQLHSPNFPDFQCSILDFGAVSNSPKPQTSCIQQAIDFAHQQGGGTVLVPSGSFLTGSIELKSNVCLHLSSKDSTLLFTAEMTEEHYPLAFCHWEASPCYNYRALLYAIDQENIGISGCGTLDGQAGLDNWWSWHHQVEDAWSENKKDLQLHARQALRKMNENGIPIEARRFGHGHFLRPNFIQFIRCSSILLEGFTLKNSPMWQVNPVLCRDVIIRGTTLISYGPNSDGCDPESCSNVLIENNRFICGDDCISLKSGRDRDGRVAQAPCQNIVIRNNFFADGHGGIALGSEMSGGIYQVYAQNNRFESPNLTYVLRFKTNAKRGGVIKDIGLYDTFAIGVNGASIHATMLYEDGPMGNFLPVFENISIENLKASGGEYGIFLEAFPQTPIRGLVLKNIEIEGVDIAFRASHLHAPHIENVRINELCYPRPTHVRILGTPLPCLTVQTTAQLLGHTQDDLTYIWFLDGQSVAQGRCFELPPDSAKKTLTVKAMLNTERYGDSRPYLVLEKEPISQLIGRLQTRQILPLDYTFDPHEPITRIQLAKLLYAYCKPTQASVSFSDLPTDDPIHSIAQAVVGNKLMTCIDGCFLSNHHITRQEMATVAMQSCGVSYKNASTTMPDCTDASQVSNHLGTNVARSLYWEFMFCDDQGAFHPNRPVSQQEALEILNRTADFAAY